VTKQGPLDASLVFSGAEALPIVPYCIARTTLEPLSPLCSCHCVGAYSRPEIRCGQTWERISGLKHVFYFTVKKEKEEWRSESHVHIIVFSFLYFRPVKKEKEEDAVTDIGTVATTPAGAACASGKVHPLSSYVINYVMILCNGYKPLSFPQGARGLQYSVRPGA